jgi:hypothetical protein
MEKAYKLRILADGVVDYEFKFATLMDIITRTVEYDNENNLVRVMEAMLRRNYDGKRISVDIAYYLDEHTIYSTLEPLYAEDKIIKDEKSIDILYDEYSKRPGFVGNNMQYKDEEVIRYMRYLCIKKFEQEHSDGKVLINPETKEITRNTSSSFEERLARSVWSESWEEIESIYTMEDFKTMGIDTGSHASIKRGLLRILGLQFEEEMSSRKKRLQKIGDYVSEMKRRGNTDEIALCCGLDTLSELGIIPSFDGEKSYNKKSKGA